MKVMVTEPGEAQDEGKSWRLQDVKLDGLVVVSGQEHADRCRLVSNHPQKVTIKGTSQSGTWQGDPVDA